jgi:hypothetical protein
MEARKKLSAEEIAKLALDNLRHGDRITVTASPARDGSNWRYA